MHVLDMHQQITLPGEQLVAIGFGAFEPFFCCLGLGLAFVALGKVLVVAVCSHSCGDLAMVGKVRLEHGKIFCTMVGAASPGIDTSECEVRHWLHTVVGVQGLFFCISNPRGIPTTCSNHVDACELLDEVFSYPESHLIKSDTTCG